MIFGTGRFSANASRVWTRRQTLAALGGVVAASLLVGCGGGSGGDGGNGNGGGGGGGSRATFTGRVVDVNSAEAAVQGAVVTLNGVSTTTGADGSFSLQAPAFATVTNATVVGPTDNAGRALYYRDGFYGGVQYNLAINGFPVQPILAGEARNLGTVKLGSQSGPPFPPGF